MKERKYALREKILMYFDVWILWLLNAISDFLWFMDYLVLSFLPFLWKVDTLQFKRPVPILHELARKMHNLCMDWWYKAQERRCEMVRKKLKKGVWKDAKDKGEPERKEYDPLSQR